MFRKKYKTMSQLDKFIVIIIVSVFAIYFLFTTNDSSLICSHTTNVCSLKREWLIGFDENTLIPLNTITGSFIEDRADFLSKTHRINHVFIIRLKDQTNHKTNNGNIDIGKVLLNPMETSDNFNKFLHDNKAQDINFKDNNKTKGITIILVLMIIAAIPFIRNYLA